MLNFVKSRLAGKRLLLQIVALLLLNFTTLAQEDFSWVNPLPQGNDLNDVFLLDDNTIIAVGDRGTLLRSENSGADWEITYRLSNIKEDIVDIQFVSDQKGYLLANDPISKIILTEDKGINWKVIAEFDSLQLNDLFFIDENIGWAIGINNDGSPPTGIILKSSNGGHNWDTIYVGPNVNECCLYSIIQFIDYENGWAVGNCESNPLRPNAELLRTTDEGENWSLVNDSLGLVSSFQFLNSDIGWLTKSYFAGWISGYCELEKTTDGGLTWEVILSTYFSLTHPRQYLYFVSLDTGWVKVGNDIHKTTDGGISWTVLPINSPNDGAIHFSNILNGCAVGNYGGIITTADGGQSWIERSELTIPYDLISVDFYNENIGWATVQYSTTDGNHITSIAKIFQSIDAGNSWEEQFAISTDKHDVYLRNILSVGDQVAYAGGTNVYKTSDGGINWDEVLHIDAHALFLLNEETGFVGSGQDSWGIIHKTTNGGIEWDTVLAVQNHLVKSISFINNLYGWALVNEAQSHIYKTYDSGDTWQEISEINLDLKSICFSDEQLGLAVGNDGVIMRTLDGGSTWDEIWNKVGYELKSVTFTSSDKAVTVGQEGGYVPNHEPVDGIIVSIQNVGGAHLIQWESWTPGLNDICFNFNNNTGWAVGNAGTIIKTGSGATVVEEEKINEIPSNYYLSNNFPDPFNPSTKIRYSIPLHSKVVINVFDILGNEIETLVNEEKQTGIYEINWYAEGLPSGIYFYRLQAGNPSTGSGQGFVETKKMLLLK